MKRLISFILAVFVMGLNNVALADNSSTNKPKDILVLGDSISSGFGLDNYEAGKYNTENYSNILAKKYGIEKRVNNFAIDGLNSTQLLDNLKRGKYDDYIMTSDVILVSIGGNDLLEVLTAEISKAVGVKTFGDVKKVNLKDKTVLMNITFYLLNNNFKDKCVKATSKFQPNFNEITEYIYQKNPNAVTVYQTVFNPFSAVEKLKFIDDYCYEIFNDLNNTIKNNSTINIDGVEKDRYYVADVYTQFNKKSLLLTNIADYDVHPNKLGHEKIAEIIDEIISTKDFTHEVLEIKSDIKKENKFSKLDYVISIICITGIVTLLRFRVRKR